MTPAPTVTELFFFWVNNLNRISNGAYIKTVRAIIPNNSPTKKTPSFAMMVTNPYVGCRIMFDTPQRKQANAITMSGNFKI